jgi:hypothetical protein
MSDMGVYPVEQILGALLEMRDNERCEKKVSLLIRNLGWPSVVKSLRKCRESEAIIPGWDTHLREGILREGLIFLLHLEHFVGLDVDFLEAFVDLEVEDIDDLRKQVRPIAVELMKEQIRSRNTFFMDVDSMKEEDLVVFVPDILNARMKEVQDLGPKPDLYEVYSTYYGFQILTTRVNHQQAGVPDELRDSLLMVLGEVGEVSTLRAKQLKFSSLAFRNCSPHLTVLLWNMLRFSNGGKKAKVKALEVLGELGDSRAIDLMHSYVEVQRSSHGRTTGSRLLDECLLCLGRIGHPQSFELLREVIPPAGLIALGGIRHPEVQSIFRNYQVRYVHRQDRIQLVTAFGKTRSRDWLSLYESTKQAERAASVRQAIEHAEKNVHPPLD